MIYLSGSQTTLPNYRDGKKVFAGGNHFSHHWKHKIYKDKESAIHAIKQSEKGANDKYVQIKYRIAPVYVLDEFEEIN